MHDAHACSLPDCLWKTGWPTQQGFHHPCRLIVLSHLLIRHLSDAMVDGKAVSMQMYVFWADGDALNMQWHISGATANTM